MIGTESRIGAPLVLLLVLFLLAPAAVSAQQGRVSGAVRATSGEPVSSATVRVAGTSNAVLTDPDGRYVLVVEAGSVTLEVTSLGYDALSRSVRVGAGEAITVDFRMSSRAVELDELLISVSATMARRAEIGTDVERLDAAAAVSQGAIESVSGLLKARAPGVSVTQASGSVGGASTIRVRGTTSLTQDNNPIIYVDGIRVSNASGTGPGSFDFGNGQTISRLDDINPQDIASIQVLKGPTAAALYGSEAAAGVILIETKSGGSGGTQWTLSGEQGVSTDVTEYPDNYYNLTRFAGVTDITDARIQQFRPVQNPATGDIYARNNPLESPVTSPFRDGLASSYTLSLRGGTEQANYFTSLQYEKREGTLPNNGLERYSFRLNAQTKPSEASTLSLNTAFTSSSIRLPDNDRSAVGMLTNAGAGLPGFSFGENPDGSRGDCLATLLRGLPEGACVREGNLTANFDKLATIENTQDMGRFIGGLTFQWTPVSWLSHRLVGGIDYIQTKNLNLVPVDPDRPFGPNSAGLVNDTRLTDRILSLDYAVTATAQVTSDLSSSTTLGAQHHRTRQDLVGCNGRGGFASNTATACNAALTFSGQSDLLENAELGALLQQRFGWRSYLYGTGGIRVDDNSAFGANQGAIWSPSFNVSAVLSDMPFWRVPESAVNNLRLRVAWGTAAQAPAPFAQAQTLRPVRLAEEGGGQLTGVSPLDPGNPDLTAERNAEWEFGLDARLLSDRVGFKFTHFRQKTTDAIVTTNVPPSTGFSGVKYVNLGAIENKGFEALITANVYESAGTSLDVSLQASTQDPIVASLGGQPTLLFGLGADHQMHREGYAPGAYYGEVISEAQRDANGDIIPGSIVYLPGNVNDPSNPRHRYLGRSEASNEQSVSGTLTLFGRLRLFTLFDRAGGFQKFNDTETFRSPFIPEQSGSRRYAFRKVESTPAEQAMMEAGGAARNALFIEDATYIKWREVTITWDLPQSIATRLGPVSSATLAVGGRNLHTWTNYSGYDPELRFDGGRDSFNAADFFTLPPPRTFFVRLNVSF